MRTLTYIILGALLVLAPSGSEAKKAASAPAGPTSAQQEAFIKSYYEAVDAGPAAFKEFSSKIQNKPGDEGALEAQMLNHMNEGKAPDGGELKGFRGDPTDPGPTDLSNWDIQTDADGNVTGFKEKDFEAKDTDGDGEISDAERQEWDKKKKEEHDAAGGPPGEVDIAPDWDRNRDGKPDPGFSLDCYQCVQPDDTALDDEDFCHGNHMGPCPGTCAKDEKCEEYSENGRTQSVMCHSCEKKDFCESHGYSSDPKCGGACKQGPCVPLDIDKRDGKIVPTMQTRERGSTIKCYGCMKVTEIEITYVIIIIETPHGRVVLDNPLAGLKPSDMLGFSPQKVMALATPNNPAIVNLQKIAALSGGQLQMFTPSEIAGTLSNMLGKKKGNAPDDCFKDFPQPPSGQGALPSAPESPKAKKKDQPSESRASATAGEDFFKDLAVDGPVIACGSKDGHPALAIFDSHGGNATLIDKAKLAADPQAVLNGIQKAQGFYQRIAAIIQNPVQVITQEGMSMLSEKILERRPSETKEKKKAKKPQDPDDPLYFDKEGAAKESWAPKVSFGGGTSVMEAMSGGADKEDEVAADQWGLRAIGYLPRSDKQSAWNALIITEPNVTVAVIDSGMDLTHPDGPKYIWTNVGETPANGIDDDNNGYVDDVHGWNFLDENTDLSDHKGHGTAVAGIIAAQSNNGIGITGINPGAVIMPLKVADKEGRTDSLAIYRAINYAVDNGAKVINVSLGGRGISQLERSAISAARRRGVLVVVASGNTGEYIPHVGPASVSEAFSVGMINIDGTRSPVSSWGPNNGLLAPGEQIISLRSKESFRPKKDSIKTKEYFSQNGTSFAAPMVAATASLMLVKDPSLTADELETILMASAKDIDEPGWDERTGAGVLDATAALNTASAKEWVIAQVDQIHIQRKDNALDYVDVYGTVRGPFQDYVVELGKGKNPGGFKKVSGTYTQPSDGQWLARIPADQMRGSVDWVVRISVRGRDGKLKTARSYFHLGK